MSMCTHVADRADDGQIIFELAWAQGVGCAIMGTALGLKGEITEM
jgi:hypothetical protein